MWPMHGEYYARIPCDYDRTNTETAPNSHQFNLAERAVCYNGLIVIFVVQGTPYAHVSIASQTTTSTPFCLHWHPARLCYQHWESGSTICPCCAARGNSRRVRLAFARWQNS